MPTLTQISNLESLALNALQKVLTTTDNPHIIVRAANAILRYCKSSASQRKGPGMGNMNAEIIKGPTPTSPSQREGAGGRAMSSMLVKVRTTAPSPDPFTHLLTKHEVSELRRLMPTLPMNQILDPKLVKRWRSELERQSSDPRPILEDAVILGSSKHCVSASDP